MLYSTPTFFFSAQSSKSKTFYKELILSGDSLSFESRRIDIAELSSLIYFDSSVAVPIFYIQD